MNQELQYKEGVKRISNSPLNFLVRKFIGNDPSFENLLERSEKDLNYYEVSHPHQHLKQCE